MLNDASHSAQQEDPVAADRIRGSPSFSFEYSLDTLRITIAAPKNPEVVSTLRRWIPHEVITSLVGVGLLLPLVGLFSLIGTQSALSFRALLIWMMVALLLISVHNLLLASYLLQRQITGSETLHITPQGIEVQIQVRGTSRTKRYSAVDISNLHVAKILSKQFSFSRLFGNPRYFCVPQTGPIAFRYQRRLVRTGFGVSPEEANQIVAVIQQSFPQYKT